MPHRRDIRRETNAGQINVVNRALFVRQTKNIAGPRTRRLKRLHRVLQAAVSRLRVAEVTQKRIARPQRKKAERWNLRGWIARRSLTIGKESVYDFVRSAVSANRDEFSIAASVSAARESRRLARGARLYGFNRETRIAQAFQRSANLIAATTAARGGINNC